MSGDVAEWLVAAGAALAAVSGVPGLAASRQSPRGERAAVALLSAGSLAGLAGAVAALTAAADHVGLTLRGPLPGARVYLKVDAISALFLIQIFAISLLGAIYGLRYWKQAEHADNGRKLRVFYGLVTAGMAVLVCARDAITFLWGWEVMALAAFLLITTEEGDTEARAAGYVYLVATRIGTLCLFAMFAVMFRVLGTWDLDVPLDAKLASGPAGTAIFLLGLAGFGLKAGLMPLHVWLPGAHANAPSHVSALMSGVLIKMGIYGLVRLTSLVPAPPPWWGGVLLGLGLASGVLGVAFAIGQHDAKRLLAYHSVENIGIICMGLGLALLARASGRPELVTLGLAGALLHVWNHGLFKSLLFLAVGSVVHATGTREMDRLGGLGKAMPRTALAFLIGAVAICGLPPLNGFISELFIYLGLFGLTGAGAGVLSLAAAFSAAGLALIGALALACFVKAYGAMFLGEPRSAAARRGHEAPASMTGPMAALALACAFIGVGSPLVAPVLDTTARIWAPDLAPSFAAVSVLAPLMTITAVSGVFLAALISSSLWLATRIRRSPAAAGTGGGEPGTWDCGYAAPSARMQYTSSSFAQGLVALYGWALRPKLHRPMIQGPFPETGSFSSHVPDVVLDRLLVPAARGTGRGLGWFRWVQRGSVHAYLIYILATLVWLLLWQRGR
jgi:hydrogenase-4 component B